MSKQYTAEDRFEAALAWLITGDSREAASMCVSGVTDRTIRNWMHEPWWQDALAQAQETKQKELDAIYTGLIHKTSKELKKRLDEGDAVITKNGEIKYLPVKAKDLAVITGVLIDKRAIGRGQATRISKSISVEEKLNKIVDGLGQVADDREQKSRSIN